MTATNLVDQQTESRLKRVVRGSSSKDEVFQRISGEFPDARITRIIENGPRQWRIIAWLFPDDSQFDVICDR